jgi:hypothetical protein
MVSEILVVLLASVLGLGVFVAVILLVFMALFLFMVLVAFMFFRSGKILVPKMTLAVLNILEDPLAFVMKLLRIRSNELSEIIVAIRNRIFDQTAAHIGKNDRMLFLPYCLRSRECLARLEEDGLICIMCGRCDIGRIKKEAEEMGYSVYIVPGSSLIKKIISNKKPKAVIGVGCHSEVKAGTSKMAAMGMPAKGLMLKKDGCIDTVVDIDELMELLKI